MRVPHRLAVLVGLCLVASCKLGPGKMPNPQWIPTVEERHLGAYPAEFDQSGHRFTVQNVLWVETTTYVLVRLVDRVEYELRVDGVVTRPDVGGQLIETLRELPVTVLDAAGQEIPIRGNRQLHLQGPAALAGLSGFRGHFNFEIYGNQPAVLLFGDARIALKP